MQLPESVRQGALEALPAWAPWAPLGAGLLLAVVVPWLVVGLPLGLLARRATSPPNAHWSEEARARWPTLSAIPLSMLTATGMLGYAGALLDGPLNAVGSRLLPFATALATLAVAGQVGGVVANRLPGAARVPRFGLRQRWAWNWMLFGHVVIAGVGAVAMPRELADPWVWVTLGAVLLATLWFVTRGVWAVPRMLGVLGPVDESLRERIERDARAAGLDGVRCAVLRVDVANAFALLHARAVVLTRGAIDALTREQLDAIVRHELEHLAESRGQRLAHASRVFALAPLVLTVPLGSTLGVWHAFLAFLPSILLLLLTRRVGRAFETRADEAAHRAESDAGVYAHALKALHRTNRTPAVLGDARRPHADLYDRMTAAGATPDFERPAPPDQRSARSAMLVATLVAAAIPIGLLPARWELIDASDGSASLSALALALDSTNAYAASVAAEAALHDARPTDAERLRALAAFLDDDWPWSALQWLSLCEPSAPREDIERLVHHIAAAVDAHESTSVHEHVATAELAWRADLPDLARIQAERALGLGDATEPRDPWWLARLAHVWTGTGDARAATLLDRSLAATDEWHADDALLAGLQGHVAERLDESDLAADRNRRADRLADEQDLTASLARLRAELDGPQSH